MPRLNGKHCLVTETARDIGIAAYFVKLGVTSETDWAEIAKRFPTIDVVVNKTGITGFEDPFDGALSTHDPEHANLADWRAVHAVNLDGTFLGCRYAIRARPEKGTGAMINIFSRSGLVGISMAAAYESSKAAVRNHTKAVALYCAGQELEVRCNSIHPAAVMMPMREPMLCKGPNRDDRAAAIVADTPLQRFGQPEEIVALAVLPASDEATFMAGAELTIDGGILAG